MADWPEFELKDAAGALTTWTRKGDPRRYVEGLAARVEFAEHPWKNPGFSIPSGSYLELAEDWSITSVKRPRSGLIARAHAILTGRGRARAGASKREPAPSSPTARWRSVSGSRRATAEPLASHRDLKAWATCLLKTWAGPLTTSFSRRETVQTNSRVSWRATTA